MVFFGNFLFTKKESYSCRGTKLPIPRPQAQHLLAAGAAPPARAFLLSPTAPFLPTAEEMGERTPAETAFLHFLSAQHLFAAVRFPSRNRRFPDRCRSPDCASTAFRCRCLLLRQKLFVLPCRRLRNHYILCPTGTPTFAALRRQRRDLIIATRPAHQPLPSLLSAVAAQEVQAIPEPTTISPAAPIPRDQHRQIRTCPPRAKGPLDRRSKRLSFPHFFLRRKKCGRRRPPPRQGETASPPGRRNPPRAKEVLKRSFKRLSLAAFFQR